MLFAKGNRRPFAGIYKFSIEHRDQREIAAPKRALFEP